MNKEDKCALCSHRSAHNGFCLVSNQGCKFKPNTYGIMFAEELESIQDEIMKTGKWREVSEVPNMYVINCLNIIEHRIKKLKGENK